MSEVGMTKTVLATGLLEAMKADAANSFLFQAGFMNVDRDVVFGEHIRAWITAIAETLCADPKPVDMVLQCPRCHMPHIDAPSFQHNLYTDKDKDRPDAICDRNGQVVLNLCKDCGKGESQLEWACACWTNPPHCSHLCQKCGCIWRPADVPTNGVAEVKTRGKADNWPMSSPKFHPAN